MCTIDWQGAQAAAVAKVEAHADVVEHKVRSGAVSTEPISSFDDLFKGMLQNLQAHKAKEDNKPAEAWEDFEKSRGDKVNQR